MTSKCRVITLHKVSEIPKAPIDGKPTLVYWDIACLAHPLRMALALSNVEWYDVRIVCGRGGDSNANKEEWFQAKEMLRKEKVLNFPNLPYYLDDKVQMTQSDAILRYLGKKYNLLSTDTDDHVSDMLVEEARDLDSTLIRLSYEEGAIAVAHWLSSPELRWKLDTWQDSMSKAGGTFVLGNSLTIVDLKLYTFLYKFRHAQAALMVEIPAKDVPALPFWVPAYLERIEKARPQLQEYLQSGDMNIPINNPHARFENL